MYADIDGHELLIHIYTHLAAWIGGKENELQALREAINRLDSPVCKCARKIHTGRTSWPCDDHVVYLVAGDLILRKGDATGFADPLNGVIYLNWGASATDYAGTIAREAGHLWFPYLSGPAGDYDYANSTSHTWSPQRFGAAQFCGQARRLKIRGFEIKLANAEPGTMSGVLVVPDVQ